MVPDDQELSQQSVLRVTLERRHEITIRVACDSAQGVEIGQKLLHTGCLLYTSDAADE